MQLQAQIENFTFRLDGFCGLVLHLFRFARLYLPVKAMCRNAQALRYFDY